MAKQRAPADKRKKKKHTTKATPNQRGTGSSAAAADEKGTASHNNNDSSEIPAAIRLLREHPAVVLTLGFLWISGIGFLYEWRLFSSFGVDLLHFGDTADFFLAAFNTYAALGLSLAYIAIFFYSKYRYKSLIELIGRESQKSTAQRRQVIESLRKRQNFDTISIIPMSILAAVTIAVADARSISKSIKTQATPIFMVHVRGNNTNGRDRFDALHLIGTTEKYMFLYHPTTQSVEVIPISNIFSMRLLQDTSN